MKLPEILEHAQKLSQQEREELIRQLTGMNKLVPVDQPGLQIVATQTGLGEAELLFLQITDPEKWMKRLRKEQE